MENVQNTTLKADDFGNDIMYAVLVYILYGDPNTRYQNPCVGTLLSPFLILTTLKCVEFAYHGEINLDVIVVYLRNSEVLTPGKLFVHPHRDKSMNVALILSDASMVKQFPKLPDNEFKVNQIKSCMLCGYGTEAQKLKLMDFKVIPINKSEISLCNKYGQRIESMCLHFSSVIPCRGDVGSPLVCDGVIQGIFNPLVVPRSPNCLDTFGADFTPIHPLVPWIKMVNSSIEESVWTRLNSPWLLVGTVCGALTVICVIYCVLVKIIDRSSDFEATNDQEQPLRPIDLRPSSMSRLSRRW